MNKNNISDSYGNGSVCGILLVDKPAGISSHDVVAAVRRLSGYKKIGHAGTLDPFATGLLLILAGKATRLFDFLAPLEKEYKVAVQFGAGSSTGDIDGEITPDSSGTAVTEARLLETLPRFIGDIIQKPPAYSAIKVDGERLYQKARRGEKVEAAPRRVFVKSIKLKRFDFAAQQAELLVSCSKGTYIRSLCEDIAQEIGTRAYAAALRRTAIGRFRADAASTLEELKPIPAAEVLTPAHHSFISGLGALYFLPVREVDEKEARDVTQGRSLSGEPAALAMENPFATASIHKPVTSTAAHGQKKPVRISHDGRLLAVYDLANDSTLKPLVVLT